LYFLHFIHIKYFNIWNISIRPKNFINWTNNYFRRTNNTYNPPGFIYLGAQIILPHNVLPLGSHTTEPDTVTEEGVGTPLVVLSEHI